MLEVLMGLTTSLPYMGARTLKPQKPTLQIFLGAREFRLLYVPVISATPRSPTSI